MGIFHRKPPITDREFLERVIEERDRQYDKQFRASEIAVNAALAAQEKAVTAAFLASEKAITKAEDAQIAYNARSNEFRGALSDQARDLMPRTESMTLHKGADDKLIALQITYDGKLEALRLSFEKSIDGLLKEIAGLRESRSEGTGKSLGVNTMWGYIVGAAGLAVAVAHFLHL